MIGTGVGCRFRAAWLRAREPSARVRCPAVGRAEERTDPRMTETLRFEELTTGYRAGFVGVFGPTNVGKSTFLNVVLGEKIVITSPKPQTTRNRVRCILTTDRAQVVFVDTPGLHLPENRLGRHIVREAYRGLRGLDVLLYMIEPYGHLRDFDRRLLERLSTESLPILLLVNKIDLAQGNALEETLLAYAQTDRVAELIPISATQGIGVDDAVSTLISYLPENPPLFPADVKSDQAEEFLIAELIREKVFRFTHREIPYSTAVRIKWVHEREDGLIEIKAEIVVERESQKGILIGRNGRMIRRIGSLARSDIETLLNARTFIDLVVNVRANWTKDAEKIRQLIA